MYGLAADLAASGNITLAVATVYAGSTVQKLTVNGIQYYLIPIGKKRINSRLNISDWIYIENDFKPDIVHIHGTEYSHGMDLMNARPELKYVVSIQGLVSVYHRYFLAGMSTWDVLRHITLRDILRANTLFNAKHDFYKRGLVEKEYIERANVVIGRTDWDRAHAWAINPNADYQFCNESLRNEFYTIEKWFLKNCRRNSIFLSQATYPIKGLHQVLKAVALLKDKYPALLLKIAGPDITNCRSFKARLKRSGYSSFIASKIEILGLEKHVVFLGQLNAEEMKIAYLSAHIFVCPSSIENSPNSLGEAQILGVPCIATSCGGTPSMVKDGISAMLYQFDEYEMLATKIDKLFGSDDLCIMLSENGNKESRLRHNKAINLNAQMAIYSGLINK